MPALFHALASNLWTTFLVVLFFGGSVFVHELGHFLAARRRGVHVERFSIGFGPAIWSWRGRDNVEYRIAWIPFGGYVLLPQIADLGPVEGKTEADTAALKPVDYGSRMLVFVAGALFNVLFAFALACVLWVAGVPESSESATTRIGYVAPTVDDGSTLPSPAAEAGLRVGDRVVSVDGHRVADWSDLTQTLATSAGRDAKGRPRVVFTIDRDGQQMEIVLYPRLAGEDRIRRVGISPGFPLVVFRVEPGSPAAAAGIRAGDEIVRLDSTPVLSGVAFGEYFYAHQARGLAVALRRAGAESTVRVAPRAATDPSDFGLTFSLGLHMAYPSAFRQIWAQVEMTFRTFWRLLNPHSDIGLSKMSGPIGIVHVFNLAAENGVRAILDFTILVNVNLAIFNLLPIPVLDGGHMLFATIGRLRGKALPARFVVGAQSVFMVLLFSMIIYVSYFDVRRWARDVRQDHAAAAAVQK
jgi:regulator of sigma E protease